MTRRPAMSLLSEAAQKPGLGSPRGPGGPGAVRCGDSPLSGLGPGGLAPTVVCLGTVPSPLGLQRRLPPLPSPVPLLDPKSKRTSFFYKMRPNSSQVGGEESLRGEGPPKGGSSPPAARDGACEPLASLSVVSSTSWLGGAVGRGEDGLYPGHKEWGAQGKVSLREEGQAWGAAASPRRLFLPPPCKGLGVTA